VVARILFFLLVAAWAAMLLIAAAMWSRSQTLRKWADIIGGGRLGAHVLYATIFLFYNVGITTAFAEPDYRYNHMSLLLKLIPAGYGAIAVIRAAAGGLPMPITGPAVDGGAAGMLPIEMAPVSYGLPAALRSPCAPPGRGTWSPRLGGRIPRALI
jgi:hypothetical protein